MTEAAFTPGPWHHVNIGRDWYVAEADRTVVAAIHPEVGSHAEAHFANARLIAAAPDLYEALAGLIGFAESAETKALVGDEGCLWPVEFARAALAKARGEAA
jgi:hypothetical protein